MRHAAFLALTVHCIENGLFWNSPPMGWRSWNCYGADVNQSLMEAVMSRIAKPYRNGRSLASFGYRDVGLDDASIPFDDGITAARKCGFCMG